VIREPIRVPGFPDAAAPPATIQPPAAPARPDPEPTQLDPRAGVRPLNVRVLIPLADRYRRLVRTLDDEGFPTSMAELTSALLHQGPATPDEARAAIRTWRRALDPDG
jgi:hypothetical protein